MEDAHIEAPKLLESKFFFPPHRRSHLRSETYRTLVRTLLPFFENADVSLATEFDPQQLRDAYSSPLRQATVELSGQQAGEDFVRAETGDLANEKVTAVEDDLGMNSLEDGCFHDSEVKMDVIKDGATVERSGNVSDERKLSGDSSQDNHCVHEENHRDELEAEHFVEGSEVLVDDNSSNNMRTSDQKNGGNDQISPKKFQEEIVDLLQVMAEEDSVSIVPKLSGTIFPFDGSRIGEASKPKEVNQENVVLIIDKDMHQWPENRQKELESEGVVCKPDLEIERSNVSSLEVMEVEDGEQCMEKVSEADLSCTDEEIPCEAYEKSKNSEDKAISVVVDASKVEHKLLSEDMQMDKCMIENEDIEEGEICGDSTYEFSEDPAVLVKKVVDIPISGETMNRNKIPSIQANGEAKKPVSLSSDTAEYASHENRDESKQNKSSMEASKRASIVSDKMVTGTNEDQNDFMLEERGYTVKDSGTKKDEDSCTARVSNQVLHNQVPNEHATRRKEIVSTEKETGACNKKKRGPLSEGRKEKKKILKRKKRAQKNKKEGGKRLKLHQVTVPKPVVYCRHYIKGRCQEGDKCKFSHDTIPLTKSTPCSYFARHSCMKGDDCPFDHQLSKYPCSNFVSKGSCPRGDTCMFSHKILPQEESTSTPNSKIEPKALLLPNNLDSKKKLNISGGLKNNLVTVPNYAGTSFKRTTQGGTLPKKTMGPPPIGINFLSFGKLPDHSSQVNNDTVECRNVSTRSGLCLVENSNEISRKIQPETTPKGINFLSFGRTTLQSNSEKLATPSSYNDATIPSGNQIQAASKTGHDSNELLKKIQMSTPKRTNFLSPIGKYAPNELGSSSSNSRVGSDLSVQIKGCMGDKHEGSNAILSRLPGTISSGKSSDILASSMYKGTPNSAQKALLSTLAFAAKYECLMNKSKSSGSPNLSNESNNEGRNENTSGSLKNDQAKASKLLDFLLGVGSKSNL